jgi:hypothetical protein
MAMVYGSSPDEHPADQILILRPLAFSISSGTISSVNA